MTSSHAQSGLSGIVRNVRFHQHCLIEILTILIARTNHKSKFLSYSISPEVLPTRARQSGLSGSET